ncbi:MAG: apolipoprotein N-acyltransferase [Ignavibacteria bacterium]|nr:apolipoprotein N-acyltransferase [Ignavibacteria bacterium]
MNLKSYQFILAAGLFYGLSFPPINFHLLIFFSFVILIDIILKSKNLKQVISRSYLVFLTAGLLGISWIALSGMRENADAFLIVGGVFVIVVYPLFFIPPMILFYLINKNLSLTKFRSVTLMIFPFLWTGFEYLQTKGQINFPWLFAGNSQSYNLSKIQYIDYTGVFGVSFWICVISVFIYYLIIKLSSKEWRLLSLKSITVISVIILIYFIPEIYNTAFKRSYSDTGKIKIGIIQPNVDPWKKWSGKQNDLIQSYIEQINQIHSEHSDVKLILLPETALPYYFRERHFEERYLALKNTCDSINVPLLIGTPDLLYYEDQLNAPDDAKIMKSNGMKYDTYNSAVLFEPGKDKEAFQRHEKIKLVIGSERMPYQEILPFTKSLVEWGVGLSSWQIGRDTNIFELKDGTKFNTAICYESVYPEFFADFVNRGADFSVIITNDGWWGKFFGTYQHNRFAVFRAIENRRWIARCANTGISDFIDPEGNFYEETQINEKASIVFNAGLRHEKTFYTMNGDLFSKVSLLTGILLFAFSYLLRKKKANPRD